jgi:hypothetical protein
MPLFCQNPANSEMFIGNISKYQAAYKKQFGMCRPCLCPKFHDRKRKLYSIFVNMSQALDTVNHETLWLKLKIKGLSDKIINTIRAIYKIVNEKVKTSQGISESFQIQKGVLQGETMSSVLFNIYLEDVITSLDASDTIPMKAMRAKIHALMYADDIIALAASLHLMRITKK